MQTGGGPCYPDLLTTKHTFKYRLSSQQLALAHSRMVFRIGPMMTPFHPRSLIPLHAAGPPPPRQAGGGGCLFHLFSGDRKWIGDPGWKTRWCIYWLPIGCLLVDFLSKAYFENQRCSGIRLLIWVENISPPPKRGSCTNAPPTILP